MQTGLPAATAKNLKIMWLAHPSPHSQGPACSKPSWKFSGQDEKPAQTPPWKGAGVNATSDAGCALANVFRVLFHRYVLWESLLSFCNRLCPMFLRRLLEVFFFTYNNHNQLLPFTPPRQLKREETVWFPGLLNKTSALTSSPQISILCQLLTNYGLSD